MHLRHIIYNLDVKCGAKRTNSIFIIHLFIYLLCITGDGSVSNRNKSLISFYYYCLLFWICISSIGMAIGLSNLRIFDIFVLFPFLLQLTCERRRAPLASVLIKFSSINELVGTQTFKCPFSNSRVKHILIWNENWVNEDVCNTFWLVWPVRLLMQNNAKKKNKIQTITINKPGAPTPLHLNIGKWIKKSN